MENRRDRHTAKNSDVKAGLYRLDELDDYEVADDDPDIRNWDVLTHDKRDFGKVDELIVDTSTMKVRYIDVKLNNDVYGDDEERHLLIPIGTVELDDNKKKAVVENITWQTVRQYPLYHGGPISREHEMDIRRAHRFDETNGDSEFYGHRSFDDSRYNRNRGSNFRGGNNPGFDNR